MNVMIVILRPVGRPAVHGPNDTLKALSEGSCAILLLFDFCLLHFAF